MQPGGGGGGSDHGCTEQHLSPATGCGNDRGLSRPTPSFSVIVPVASQKKQEQDPQATANLPEDAVIEILSRVPYKSLCRFKCVSKPWLALCSDPKIQSRSPKALAGFFYSDENDSESLLKDNPSALHFHSLSEGGSPPVNPSLSFLRKRYKRFMVTQSCCSLLFCRCWKSYKRRRRGQYEYVVCNPMTEQWTVLPPIELPEGMVCDLLDLNQADRILGFDTVRPSSFVVFAPLTDYLERITQVAIYSSGTGRWTCLQSEWVLETVFSVGTASVFLNGTMHFTTDRLSVVTLDTEGKVWREIQVPHQFYVSDDPYGSGSIGKSQGRLHAWIVHDDCRLSVWVLEDYDDGGKWTLKHTVDVLGLFRRHRQEVGESYEMFAMHPECNLIFLTDWMGMIVSYDMDSQEVQVISASGEFRSGLPYIPCSAKWSLDGN